MAILWVWAASLPSESNSNVCQSSCWHVPSLSLSKFGFLRFLAQFSGAGEENLKHATATFCSNQPFALEVIKSRQKKDSRFQTFVQVSFTQKLELVPNLDDDQ